jgi:hypothetical protein
VKVEWPDGTVTRLFDVAVNQELTITQGGFGDLDADGDVDLLDFQRFQSCYTNGGPGGIIYAGGCRASDFDGDGDVDGDEFAIFSSRMAGPQ